MSALSPVLLLLVVVAGAAAYVWNYVQREKERKLLLQYCTSMRWQYSAEDDSFTVRWRGTPFGTGDRRRATNVVRGTDRGVPFVAFDYQYDTESTDSRGNRTRSTHRFGVTALALPVPMPQLQVTPEGWFGRAAEAVGLGGGVQLESEDFNRHFAVHARDPKFASDVLNPRTMQTLLAAPPAAWRIEMSDVVSWWDGSMRPLDILARLSTLHHVVDGIPSFVWHDNGYDPAPPADPAPAPAPAATQAAAPAPVPAPAPTGPVPPAEGSSA